MSQLLTSVLWLGNGGADAALEVARWSNLTIKKGLERSDNSLELRIPILFESEDPYIDGSGEFLIKKDDVLKVYLKYTDDPSDSIDFSANSEDLMMVADVNSFKSDYDSKLGQWTVIAQDKTAIVLNRIFAKNYPLRQGKTAPEIIREVIKRNASDVTAEFVNYPDKSGIQITRPDGSAFPVVSHALVWKPLYEWVQQLSQPEKLNDPDEIEDKSAPANRSYRFYVDEKNVFHWFYPDSTDVDYDFDATLTWFKDGSEINTRFLTHKLQRTTFDNVNMIIHKSGEDLNGIGILDYYYDKNTKEKSLKMVFKPFVDIAERLKRDMVNDENPSLNFDDALKNYDYVAGTAYPVSVPWLEDATTFADDEDLNEEFRRRCKELGDQRASEITSKTRNPRWKGSISYTGYKFNPGELLTYSAPELGLTDVNVRVQGVTHQINKTDWKVTIDVAEDEEAITAGI